MKAIILAAGFGTRLKPLTDKVPKPLLPVNGVPLIHYPLQLLGKAGITEVVINLHHLGEQIEHSLGDGQKMGMRISYSWEQEILGTGGGIKKSASFFSGDPFLVINSDVLMDLDLTQLLRFHKKHDGIASMVLIPRPPHSCFSWIQTNKEGRILRIVTTTEPEPTETFIYAGVQILTRRFLDYLPPGPSCIIQAGYQAALKTGEGIFGLVHHGYWNDLGTPERLKQAERDLKFLTPYA